MKEYHKIETLFKREETGKHQLIIGEYRNPAVEQCKNLQWIFTEKVDGTNIRIYWDGHEVEFGGRTNNAQLHTELVLFIQSKFSTPEIEQLFEQEFGDKEVYIFGEGYGAGIQKGGGYRQDKSLIIYDVQIGGLYLPYDGVKNIADMFGVDTVPVLLEGTIQEAIDYIENNSQSKIGDGTKPLEGVVGRLKEEMFDRFGNRMIVKIKRKDFGF